MTSRIVRATVALLALVAAASCDEGLTIPPGSTGPVDTSNGKITLAMSGATTTAPVGGTATSTLTVTRSLGYNGAVVLSFEDVPAGITATANPSTIPASSATSTITFTTPATSAPSSSTVTIRGKGTLVADATTTIAVVLTAPSAAAASIPRPKE